MIPVVFGCLEDALCATTFRKKVLDYTTMILSAIALVIIMLSLKYDAVAKNNAIIFITQVLTITAPIRSITVFVYTLVKARVSK